MQNLDDAYDNGGYIEGAADYPSKWAQAAQSFREALLRDGRAELDVPYGERSRTRFDLFRPDGPSKGCLLFVHGGYWLKFDKSYWSHLAAGANAQGWHVAMPSYDLCPEVSIATISRQIAQAVKAVGAKVPGPLVLAGHSAGGHLVARVVCGDLLSRELKGRIKRVVPISPLSDLRPLMQTKMNVSFGLDEAAARADSPIEFPRPECHVHVWVGAEERPAFVDQASWLSKAWGCSLTLEKDKHHFNVIEGLENGKSALTKEILS